MNKLAVVLLLSGLAAAQTKAIEGPARSITYEFKNVEAFRAEQIAVFVGQLDRRVSIQFNGPFKTAIIQSNIGNVPQEVLEKAESLLKRYDVAAPPPPKVEFVAYLVRASDHEGMPPDQPIPPVIADAVAEMKSTFAYKHYSLLDTVSTEVHHHTDVENMVTGARAGPARNIAPFFYQLGYGDTNLSPDGKTVTVNPFKFALRNPDWPDHVGITTDVTIREGQKLVIGKVRTSIIENDDIFCVLTVKLH